MTDYTTAKKLFLLWLREWARDHGYDPTYHPRDPVLTDESGLFTCTRATLEQGTKPHFKMTDEVKREQRRDHEYDRRFVVVLDLHRRGTWDPDRDHFYPVPLWYAKRKTTPDCNGDYPITVDLTSTLLQRSRDDPTVLFPGADGGRDNRGADGGDGSDLGPSWSNCSDRVQNLRAIARDVTAD